MPSSRRGLGEPTRRGLDEPTFEDIEWMPPEQRRFFEGEGYRVYRVQPESGIAAFEKPAAENGRIDVKYNDGSRNPYRDGPGSDQWFSGLGVGIETSVWKEGRIQEPSRRVPHPSLGDAKRAARDAESRARKILKGAGEPEASPDPEGEAKEPRGPDPGEGAGLGL